MKAGQSVLLYYSVVLSLFVTLGAAFFGFQSGNVLFFLLSLPIAVYFGLKIFKVKRGRKLMLYYDFILTTIMTVMGFAGASSMSQFLSAVLFLPLALYFWLLVWPKRNNQLPLPDNMVPVIVKAKIKEEKIIKGKIKKLEGEIIMPHEKTGRNFDLDRRMFIKLIGSTGIMLFLFSLFTKKAEAAFFGSVPGPGTLALKDTAGNKIDPAEKHPTDGYKIAQVDDTSSSTYAYYGFTNKDGAWFIQRETLTGENAGDYRYARGSSSFSGNWLNRGSQSPDYDYFDEVF